MKILAYFLIALMGAGFMAFAVWLGNGIRECEREGIVNRGYAGEDGGGDGKDGETDV